MDDRRYYISTGDLAGFYTLRYRFDEQYAVSSGDGRPPEIGIRERDYYICNLSTDREEAIRKAQAHCGKELAVGFDLDEIKRRPAQEIDWSVMRAGAYEGESIHWVRDNHPDYLMWIIENMGNSRGYSGTVELAKALMAHEIEAKVAAKSAEEDVRLSEAVCFLRAVGSGKESLGRQIMTAWTCNERSGFMRDIGNSALNGQAPSGRARAVAFEILAKGEARRGSHAYNARIEELEATLDTFMAEAQAAAQECPPEEEGVLPEEPSSGVKI
jgi:hypothetical protein